MAALGDWFRALSPVVQALLAGSFTWLVTAAGAGLVFFTRSVSQRVLDAMLGFAAGVMIAASFWSLLVPAIDLAGTMGQIPWLTASVGFLLGGAFLWILDQTLPHLHVGSPRSEAEGFEASWRRTTLLVSAITLHNVPEGLAVGVSFGAVAIGGDLATTTGLAAAIGLTVGIGLQNFPEGVAVSMPLRREGVGPGTSFFYGQLSAVVEPIAAVTGAAAVLTVRPALPYALAFAAGAMIYVVVEELIPTSQQFGNTDLATTATLLGFTVMMILDVALG